MAPEKHPDEHSRAFKVLLHHVLFEENIGVSWAFSDKANYFLKRLWEAAGESIDEQDRREPAGMAALGVYEESGYAVRIIQCPEPLYFAENYFFALAWKPRRRSLLPWSNKPEEMRYLTIESSVRMIGMDGPPSVMGEWTVDAHTNYGPGPEPTEESFLQAIRPILAKERPPVGLFDIKRGLVAEPVKKAPH